MPPPRVLPPSGLAAAGLSAAVLAGAVLLLPHPVTRAGDGLDGDPGRGGAAAESGGDAGVDGVAGPMVEIVPADDDDWGDPGPDLYGEYDTARHAADALVNREYHPELDGCDLAPLLAGDADRAGFFTDIYPGGVTGGTLVYLDGAVEQEDGWTVVTVRVQKKDRPGNARAGLAEGRRLEKWAVLPDGNVIFLRAADHRFGFFRGMYDF